MCTEVNNATRGGADRTKMRVTAATETDDLAPNAVLLLREF
jgi:hypothetical protein